MLAGTSLGNDLGLSKALSEQKLANGVIDLMRTGMVHVLTLEPDVGTSSMLGQTLGQVQARRTAHVVVVRTVLLPEGRVVLNLVEAFLKLRQAVHQALGNVLATEFAKAVRNLAVHGSELSNQSVVLRLGDDSFSSRSVVFGRLGLVLGASAAAEISAVLLNSGSLLARGVTNGGNDLAANDDTVSEGGDVDKVLAGADTKANGQRSSAAALLDTLEERRDVAAEGAGGTGNTLSRDDVDERVSKLAKNLHASIGRGGGDERNVGKATAVSIEMFLDVVRCG